MNYATLERILWEPIPGNELATVARTEMVSNTEVALPEDGILPEVIVYHGRIFVRSPVREWRNYRRDPAANAVGSPVYLETVRVRRYPPLTLPGEAGS